MNLSASRDTNGSRGPAAGSGAWHLLPRAQRVGFVHHILPPERLRPYLIEAVERGMEKEI